MADRPLSSHPQASQIQICDQAFFLETLRRLPLAEAVLQVLGFGLQNQFLADLYEQHRGQCYHDILSFPCLVELISDALLVHQGSARQALLQAEKNSDLPTCKEAFYAKLRRVPLDVSVAFLTGVSQRINQLLPPVFSPGLSAQDNPLPKSLQGYQVRIFDGKKLKHVAKKLKLTRDLAGQLFGSKLLVGYDPVTRLIQAMSANPDGEANDAPLVPALLGDLRTQIAGKSTILVADAQFCDLVQISQYRKENDHFVLRYHPKLHFHADASQPRREFTDAKGRTLIEEYGYLGSPKDERRCFVRRVTWKRTDHKDLCVVTDLTNRRANTSSVCKEAIPASDLIELYLIRWTIETVFQEVTVTFGLRKLIGSTAEATAFQAAFCMVVYNAIMVVKSYVAAVQPKPMKVDDVSTKMLFTSIQKQMTALAELVPPASLTAMLEVQQTAESTAESMQEYLRERLNGLWEVGWKKAKNKSPRKQKEKVKGSGAHTSVHRVLQKHIQSQKNPEITNP